MSIQTVYVYYTECISWYLHYCAAFLIEIIFKLNYL